jgi:predicted nucleic acid-binding protein
MNPEIAVFDAGPLIAFHQINRLELLFGVFDRVVVPPAGADEVSPSLPKLPGWVEIQPVHVSPTFSHNLGAGESGAIALALQLVADFVVLDDKRARTSATRLGLTIIGSLGLLVRAKRAGLIPEVRPLMNAMIANELFANDAIQRRILAIAGEE